jgi:hypothetical protein
MTVKCVFVSEAIILPVVQVNVWSGMSLENKFDRAVC